MPTNFSIVLALKYDLVLASFPLSLFCNNTTFDEVDEFYKSSESRWEGVHQLLVLLPFVNLDNALVKATLTAFPLTLRLVLKPAFALYETLSI